MSDINDSKNIFVRKRYTFLVQHGLETKFMSVLSRQFDVVQACAEDEKIVLISEKDDLIKVDNKD